MLHKMSFRRRSATNVRPERLGNSAANAPTPFGYGKCHGQTSSLPLGGNAGAAMGGLIRG
eukprot:8582677-Lingulodinium_polyedra.AAC.1